MTMRPLQMAQGLLLGNRGHMPALGTELSVPGSEELVRGLGNSSYQALGGRATGELIAILSVTCGLSLVTVLGNVLVLLSVWLNRNLRTVSNYFLLSLALADLIIGLLSMNLYTSYIILGRWALGSLTCDLWLTLDYVVSNASVMNLLVICFDRYFAITSPLTYRAKRTPRRAAIMLGVAWCVSIMVWAPTIMCWQYIVGQRAVRAGNCHVPFLSEPLITFGTATIAFYLPVVIMTVLYARIYRETKRHAQSLAALQETGGNAANRQGMGRRLLVCGRSPSATSEGQSWPRVMSLPVLERKTSTVKEKKAARTLSAILLAFIVTWSPYNVMVLVSAFCTDCIPSGLWQLGYWLCYVNSTINPGCYALCSAEFRVTFKRLLLCHCDRREWAQNVPVRQTRPR
ncbi:muscarinic acetylcholine receptor M1-like [Chiloscyllium plagiosum]|uniref:muscarinic acetylcholine receptor M1-like n=1 Tax=Chiloscyllium plagiosum TaxID=36176 RepID=UPI001CB7B408|nr:muscarinic acetylcholine receptor M1-like [Chiloscyllium plagiosum]